MSSTTMPTQSILPRDVEELWFMRGILTSRVIIPSSRALPVVPSVHIWVSSAHRRDRVMKQIACKSLDDLNKALRTNGSVRIIWQNRSDLVVNCHLALNSDADKGRFNVSDILIDRGDIQLLRGDHMIGVTMHNLLLPKELIKYAASKMQR